MENTVETKQALSEFAEWAKDRPADEVISKFKDQLLLILVDKMGGDVILSGKEVDERPVGKALVMQNATAENPYFRLLVNKKQ